MGWSLKTGAARPSTKIPDIWEADASHTTSSVCLGWFPGGTGRDWGTHGRKRELWDSEVTLMASGSQGTAQIEEQHQGGWEGPHRLPAGLQCVLTERSSASLGHGHRNSQKNRYLELTLQHKLALNLRWCKDSKHITGTHMFKIRRGNT